MEQFGINLDVIVETKITTDEFSDRFIKWVEENGWVCGGIFKPVDEEGNDIKRK
jgi:hypothetical protein